LSEISSIVANRFQGIVTAVTTFYADGKWSAHHRLLARVPVMQLDTIRGLIDPEAIARDTLDFVKVKSETGREGDGSLFLYDLLRREGFDARLDDVEPGRPNVYVRVAGSSEGAPALLFNGHTDTIPIGPSDPPARAGDWIVGRGTEDMKGGLVAMVHAASALRRAGVQLAGDLWLTGVIGHETPIGKKEGPKRLIQLLRGDRIHADAIVIVEGPCAVWAASLGSLVYTITITSSLGPIHTVKVPYANNPALTLGRLLCRFGELEKQFELAAHHPLCGPERINVGQVHGGDFMNRLPTPIMIQGQRRWTPGKTAADVRAELQAICAELARTSGHEIQLATEGEREPFETPASHPVVQAMRAAGKLVGGKEPALIGMGLVGDANLYANDGGVPTVYYGPAHETAHSNHERVSVSQLAHCAAVYALTAVSYCGVA
jgi:acetylornithine deacetylase/succinyl-diaminopimelate desuccinylase-like protein